MQYQSGQLTQNYMQLVKPAFDNKNKDAGNPSVLTHMHNTQTQSMTTIFRLYEKHTITAQSLIQQQLVLYAQNQIK